MEAEQFHVPQLLIVAISLRTNQLHGAILWHGVGILLCLVAPFVFLDGVASCIRSFFPCLQSAGCEI